MEKNLLEKEIEQLNTQLRKSSLPPDLLLKAEQLVLQLRFSGQTTNFTDNFQKVKNYIDWIVALPWKKKSEDILDLGYAKKVLEENHYGLAEIKERVLEYISVLILKRGSPAVETKSPVLCFVGLVGTGKTTVAQSVAQALGRKIVRIPFGGLGDPLYLRGQSRFYPGAEPGQIIKGVKNVGVKNPVILLDEIDRVADETLNTIMGVLVELLDPEQNSRFTDHFIDYPFDLSSALFITTANQTRRIATAVLDRLEVIQMPSYNDEEKMTIGKSYLLPRALKEAGLDKDQLIINDDCWSQIIRPLGFDAGLRTLKRTIDAICRRIAKLIVETKKKSYHLTLENLKEFLPGW